MPSIALVFVMIWLQLVPEPEKWLEPLMLLSGEFQREIWFARWMYLVVVL